MANLTLLWFDGSSWVTATSTEPGSPTSRIQLGQALDGRDGNPVKLSLAVDDGFVTKSGYVPITITANGQRASFFRFSKSVNGLPSTWTTGASYSVTPGQEIWYGSPHEFWIKVVVPSGTASQVVTDSTVSAYAFVTEVFAVESVQPAEGSELFQPTQFLVQFNSDFALAAVSSGVTLRNTSTATNIPLVFSMAGATTLSATTSGVLGTGNYELAISGSVVNSEGVKLSYAGLSSTFDYVSLEGNVSPYGSVRVNSSSATGFACSGTVSGIGSGDAVDSINIAWTIPAESYDSAVSAGRVRTLTGAQTSAFQTSQVTISGATLSDAYTYTPWIRVREYVSGVGLYRWGVATSGLTFNPPDITAPTVPGSLQATWNNSYNRVDLTWGASSDNITPSGSIQYQIYWSQSASTPSVGATPTATISAQAIQYNSPTQGTWYFWVRAQDGAGNKSAWSSPATATVPDYAGPTMGSFIVTPSFGSASVSWTAASDPSGINRYVLYYRPDDGGWQWTEHGTYYTELTNLQVTGLLRGYYYYFQLYVYDNLGNYSTRTEYVWVS